ncbi:eCIS core domain-containing protein [Mucilaginibacter xinganensis]|uniref:eCIS core domain-containing protein n=1 Tax=Mucilaginibacter xinganensis TaxID=1234841 RepID=A0A223NW41_9SPHI|nr:DUF4157 domain-containing protein [Mucilaginibacter xinganensis]ASU33914.1 hypothetical protein MuYL_2022 [Mucilaginibacter xinganensis]
MSRQSNYRGVGNSGMISAGGAASLHKATVGGINSAFNNQPDKMMRMPETPFVQRKAAGSCGEFDDEHVHLKRAPFIQTKSLDGGTASEAVSGKIKETKGGGSSMAATTKNFMENRFGTDFSGVKIHTGDYAAQMSNELNAHAFTVGSDIYFNSGKYAPGAADGKRLLAHELTHVVQQSGSIGRKIQRQERQGGMSQFTLTTNWDIQFLNNKPSPAEITAAPSAVLTASGLGSLNMIRNSFLANPNMEAELEGNASIEGTPENNQALSIRRARYIGQQLGIGRIHDVPGGSHTCARAEDGIYGCGTANAHSEINPLDRRVKVSMFTPTPAARPAFPSGSGTIPGITPAPPATGQPAIGQPATPSGGTEAGNQISVQPGFGGVGHTYLGPSSATDPAAEAVVQLGLAFTHQFASRYPRHVELQGLVQLQISLSTGTVSIAGGSQLSYVVPFAHNHLQWSAFVQALIGSPFNPAASFQFQPSIGTQLVVTPSLSHSWFQFGGQGSTGFTLQTGGPQSVDYGGGVFIQFVR